MSEFHFLRPWWFLALLPVLLLLIGAWRGRSRGTVWRAVCDQALLDRLWLEPPGKVSRLPWLLAGLGWLLAVVALAGPAWERQPEPVWRSQAARVLVLDLSASMNAADPAPSRLERARFKIRDMLARADEGRIGLVVVAGEPHTVAPLTDDVDTVANLRDALATDIVPAAGDAAAPALALARALLEQAGVEVFVIEQPPECPNFNARTFVLDTLTGKMSDDAYNYWVKSIGTAYDSKEWKEVMASNGMAPLNLRGAAFQKFVKESVDEINELSVEIGIVKK